MNLSIEFKTESEAREYQKWLQATGPEMCYLAKSADEKWVVSVKPDEEVMAYSDEMESIFQTKEEAFWYAKTLNECSEDDDIKIYKNKTGEWCVKARYTIPANINESKDETKKESVINENRILASAPSLSTGLIIKTFDFFEYKVILAKNCSTLGNSWIKKFIDYNYKYSLFFYNSLSSELKYVFTYESSTFGTTCLGGFSSSGSHDNYGEVEKNILIDNFLSLGFIKARESLGIPDSASPCETTPASISEKNILLPRIYISNRLTAAFGMLILFSCIYLVKYIAKGPVDLHVSRDDIEFLVSLVFLYSISKMIINYWLSESSEIPGIFIDYPSLFLFSISAFKIVLLLCSASLLFFLLTSSLGWPFFVVFFISGYVLFYLYARLVSRFAIIYLTTINFLAPYILSSLILFVLYNYFFE